MKECTLTILRIPFFEILAPFFQQGLHQMSGLGRKLGLDPKSGDKIGF